MNRFRRGRPDRFTMISNQAIDEFEDIATVGLLAKVLRLPDNYRITMDELSVRLKGTSRKALYACMRSLVDKAYVVKVKHQDAKGHWRTDSYSFDPPCTPQEAADIDAQYVGQRRIIEPCWLDPAWIAEQPDTAPPPEEEPPPPYATRVSAARTDLSNRQAGATRENSEKPSSHRPAVDRPVGNRPVGNPQALKKTVPKTGENLPSSPTPPDEPPAAVPEAPRRKEERSGVKERQNPHVPAVEAATVILDGLPGALMAETTAGQRRDLIRHLVPRLEAGWEPPALIAELRRDLDTVTRPVGAWIARLVRLPDQPDTWTPTRTAAPNPGALPQSAWCGACTGPSYRFIERDADGTVLDNPIRCSCHPGSVAHRRWTKAAAAEHDRAAALRDLEAAYPACHGGEG